MGLVLDDFSGDGEADVATINKDGGNVSSWSGTGARNGPGAGSTPAARMSRWTPTGSGRAGRWPLRWSG